MRIMFVHTPVALSEVDGRTEYWQSFDDRYRPAHPGLQPMRRPMWELPHWIPWLAGVLAADGFEDLGVLDLYADYARLGGIDEDGIRTLVAKDPADVYLFSPMTVNVLHALRICEIIKEEWPYAKTVFGGVTTAPLRDWLTGHDCLDWVVLDRGERALPHLLQTYAATGDVSGVGNLSMRDPDGRPWTSPLTYPAMDLADLPFPKVDVFEPEVGQDLRYIRQNYAVGCPFHCDFCTIPTIGRRPDYFEVSRVLAETDAYRAHYGEHHAIYFGDETFTLHPDRTRVICDALRDRPDISFDCQTRLNCLRDVTLPRTLAAAGCRWLEIGLESVNQSTQASLKQHTDVSAMDEVLRRLADEGVPTCTYIITGLPGETPDDVRRSIDGVADLISRNLLTATYVSNFVPYPGTAYFRDPDRFGLRLHHRDFTRYDENLPPVFDTPTATSEAMYEVFLDAVAVFTEAMQAGDHIRSSGAMPMSSRP